MKSLAILGVLLCLIHSPFAQRATGRLKFSDYPVGQIYQGKPAVPILSKSQRWYRTVIREERNPEFNLPAITLFQCSAAGLDVPVSISWTP